MSNRSNLFGMGLAIALLGAPGQAWAETIVLRASGPSAAAFTPGQRLPDVAEVRLVEGDSLSLLSSGKTVQLRGPFDGPVRVSGAGEPRPFNWLAMLKASPRVRAAGSRGPAAQILASN